MFPLRFFCDAFFAPRYFAKQGASSAPVGPFFCAAATVYIPGAVAGKTYTPGAVAGKVAP